MSFFPDFMLPQNNGLNDDQLQSARAMGFLNAASALANMSAPQAGPKATALQLITGGLQGYGQGANNYLKQFYDNQKTQADNTKDQSEAVLKQLIAQRAQNYFNPQTPTGPTAPAAPPASLPSMGGLSQFYTPDALTQAQIKVESNGNPNAVSPKGAQGLMQIMPATAKDPGLGVTPMQNDSPQENVRVGQDYQQALMQKYGNLPHALMAYNWGTGNVDKWLASGADPAKVPTETKNYVSSVVGNMGGQPAGQAAPHQADTSTSTFSKELYKYAADQNKFAHEQGILGLPMGGDGSDLMKLAAMYDPALERVNNQNLPAVIQVADELRKARASGDKQRIADITALSKIYDRGVIGDPNGGVTNVPGYTGAVAGIAGAKAGGEVTGKTNAEAAIANRNAIQPIEELKKLNEGSFDMPFMDNASKVARLSPSDEGRAKAQSTDLMRQARLDLAAPLAKQLGVNPTDKDFQASLDRIFDMNSSKESRAAQILALEHRIQARMATNPYNNAPATAAPTGKTVKFLGFE